MDEINMDAEIPFLPDVIDVYISMPYLALLNRFQDIFPDIMDELIIALSTKIEDREMLLSKKYYEYAMAYSMENEKIQKPDMCPVCMLEAAEITTPLFKTGCGHVFCGSCFFELLLENIDTCPMCRSELDPRACKFCEV